MNLSDSLKPELLWHYFDKVISIPRPSKKETQIIEFLIDFGNEAGLATKQDKVGNILISKPASKGLEDRKTVVLQSHIDIVCEKNDDKVFDFENDSIEAFIDGDWVTANGTTLGADDGIGVATQLAILADDTIEHGPLECLFTIDEETGMTGAKNIDPKLMSADIMINLDSEDEGEICIGCAGGIDTVGKLSFSPVAPSSTLNFYRITIYGLKGGHSADAISQGMANANKLLGRFLWEYAKDYKFELADFNGGNLRNAVAREANAVIGINDDESVLIEAISKWKNIFKTEYGIVENSLDFTAKQEDTPEFVIDDKTCTNFLNVLYAIPHGVYRYSDDMPGFVETSTNLASVKFVENEIKFSSLTRSSGTTNKLDLANMIETVYKLGGAEFTHSGPYPGWMPNAKSAVLAIAKKEYSKLFGKDPKVVATHGGLECGLIFEKYPKLDVISIGPTIKGAHSPDERMNIETVSMFWKFLLELLKNIGA